MDQYAAMINERKRREMEAEMSRFEQEICAPQPVFNNFGQPATMAHPHMTHPAPSVQFLPHSIQRQMPRSSHQHQQPQFVDATYNIQMAAGHVNNSANNSNTTNSGVGYTVTPMGMPTMTLQTPAGTSSGTKRSKSHSGEKKKQKKMLRQAGGTIWEDNSLMEWDPDDFRIFCGDLGNDVTDEVLTRAFNRFSSFVKAKVVRDKRTNKTKGYGFVSFKDPQDFSRAMREMNGKYVGSRPIKLRKSTWKDRNLDVVRKKHKEKAKLGLI